MHSIFLVFFLLAMVIPMSLSGKPWGGRRRWNGQGTKASVTVPKTYKRLPPSVPTANFTTEELDTANKISEKTEIRMTSREIALLMRCIAEAKFLFEFGCGGSTKVASFYGPPKMYIHSLDSNRELLQSVANSSLVRERIERRLIALQFVNLGPVGVGGYPSATIPQKLPLVTTGVNAVSVPLLPAPNELRSVFAAYPNAIGNITANTIDVVLVNGRFRVACALNAALTQPNAVLLVHDFLEPGHFQSYGALLDVLYIVESADTLVRLRRKDTATDEALQAMLDQHIHIAS